MEELQLDENRILEVLEPKRKKRNMFIFLMLGCFLISMGGIAIAPFFGQQGVIVASSFFVAAVIFVAASIMLGKVHKEYENEYKDLISKHVLRASFDDAQYYPLKGFTPKEFRDAHLIQWRGGFQYSSEDLIIGQYVGVEFKQSDVRITHNSGSGRNRQTVVDVDGRLTQFHYKKAIESPILIVTATHNALLETGLSRIKMEDVDFNEKFEVYSEDGHSVYYLLTPPFMEYLKELCKLDRNLYISFDGEYLYVLRSGKGGIFLPPGGKLDIHAEVEKSRKELSEIVKIIEILKLDDKAWKEKITDVPKPAGNTPEKMESALMEMEEKPYVMTKLDVEESKGGNVFLKIVMIIIWFSVMIKILLATFLAY
ncbi:MAG: DUF3137 domain-containing protein [Lachnospiraceae bacterium]|nr:DUF3137 domain-containing protein [Lachnospiraceae bacterium]